MIIEPKWLDRAGNIKPNSWQADSENPSTFNAIVAILHHQLYGRDRDISIALLNRAKWQTNGGKYMTNSFDALKYQDEYAKACWWDKQLMKLNFKRSSDRFSHDETTGVICSSFYFSEFAEDGYGAYHKINISKIMDVSGQTFYRFYDVTPMIRYAKKPWRDFDRERVISFAKQTCKSKQLDARGAYAASGKIQAWLKLNAMGSLEFEEATSYLPETYKWREVFRNYFPEKDHPINLMAKELYV